MHLILSEKEYVYRNQLNEHNLEYGSTSRKEHSIPEHRALFEGLKKQEPWAIRQLGQEVGRLFFRLPDAAGVHQQDKEELVNDTLVVVLSKLEEGSFEFQGASPAAYAMAVARNLLNNWLRKRRLPSVSLDDTGPLPDATLDDYFDKKEKEQLLGNLLAQMGEDCQRLIRLRYFEEIKDEQAIERQLTKYSTVDSLKNKRCKCLKKLSELAKQHQHLFR
ncbi:MAG: sigma-70 family RNA polymerase sigma factor [Phaeodactylibacter sp.]|nr:sigma-70 family RNA polymerase sigma factor [Phaeodactylibacter sp.]MCB9051698.1 sigma-70 family RNA polymerase sigma factor [Lewinellaceae bacterium]